MEISSAFYIVAIAIIKAGLVYIKQGSGKLRVTKL